MKKATINVNDEVSVEFLKNSGSGRPVCRVNGKIGFIDKAYKGFIPPGSSWMVKVIEIKPQFVTVVPILETHTAKENHEAFKSKLESMKGGANARPIKNKEFTTIIRM